MTNILYVFQRGRLDRIQSNKSFAKEMFYSYFYFKEKYEDTEIIEFVSENWRISRHFFYNFDQLMKKLRLPFYTNSIVSMENLKLIFKKTHLILSTNRVAFSTLPMVLVSKLLFKKINVSFFVLGMFRNKPKYKILEPFRKFFIHLLLLSTNNLIFLGEGEYRSALKDYGMYKKKFKLLPFAIDSKFWDCDKKYEFRNKEYILFIGNDENRNFQLVIDIAKKLPELNFVFLTNKILSEDIDSENIKLLNGAWHETKYDDEFIRELYENAKITILPLNDSLQPSGQSVTLQSMSMGVPVMITKTSGFWDFSSYIDNQNIIFMKNNEIDEWVNRINYLNNNQNLLNKISIQGEELIKNKFNLESYGDQLSKIINI